MGLTNKLMAFGAICMYIASWYNLGCTAMPPVSSMGNQVMLDIPENDRELFLSHQLYQGIQLSNRTDIVVNYEVQQVEKSYSEKFMNKNVPRDFSAKLLQWTENVLKSVHINTNKKVCKGNICIQNSCIDAKDIGQLCCPF